MSFYENRLLPFFIDFACSAPEIMAFRARVVPEARGDVLEVGMGSAINLGLYDADKVNKVYGLEPSVGMRRKAQKNLARSAVDVQWLDLPGEQIPLADKSVDSIVLTFTLCSIADWKKALQQMHRVLKDDGVLLFCEHGLAPDAAVQQWQHRLTPFWRKCAGGCHLNRPVVDYLQQGGFMVQQSEQAYMPKAPRFAGFMSVGRAVKQL